MSQRGARTSVCGYAPRLFGYAIALIAVAVPMAAGAVAVVVLDPPGTPTIIGVSVFFALTLLAELKPVPLDEEHGRLVSLAFVFIVSAQILFGWEFGVLISAVALVVAQVVARTPVLRTTFNAAAYSVAAFAASVPGFLVAHGTAEPHFGRLTLLSFGEGAIFVSLNVVLVCMAIALHEGVPARNVVVDHLRHSGPAFAIMAFIAALAVALWSVSPPLLFLLAGPVFALALFQRYALRTRVALRAASTDSLTRLPNHRSYESDIVAALESGPGEVALCLLDIDNFKRLNDRFGHPVGDRLLVRFAELLREHAPGATAYRLGGDEFALIAPGGEDGSAGAVKRIRAALVYEKLPDGSALTFSAGMASHPRHAATREELARAADAALYWAKRHGKDRWCVFDPSVVALSWSRELAATVEHDARLRATESLIRVVDARDTYTGNHSQSVAVLVETIGEALGLDPLTVAQLRLAGLLHDLGKIAVPDRILQKPGRLDLAEFSVLRRHPEHGHELLQGLEVDPVDQWILHHHEHWDGSGYPQGLKGEQIPIGSRVILVADAFDAITSERCYRPAASVAEALEELRRFSGAQFDPAVVDALERALAATAAAPAELAGRVA
jgi:diguanylate cyclase (GGDEF)-like protein